MANLLTRLLNRDTKQRFTTDDYLQWVYDSQFNGYSSQNSYEGKPTENSPVNFGAQVQGAYKANGVVFACMSARMKLFTEARFLWQRMKAGRPSGLFWTPGLSVLERPWVNGQTGDLLARMIQDADISGNCYLHRTAATADSPIERLRPDWTYIALGYEQNVTTPTGQLTPTLMGYYYQPGGSTSSADPLFLAPETVAHWAPIPDPEATYRGMSWLTPVMRSEVRGDLLASQHKVEFFEHAAVPNMVVRMNSAITLEKFKAWKELHDQEHRGVRNAYKTMFLGGGADEVIAGLDFKQMDFKTVQGHGETRIAAAAGVPPIVVGLSEGLDAATYSNYGQARRAFADLTMRPLWRSACAAIEAIVPAPSPSRLWVDFAGISALQEDAKDAAEIHQVKATTITQYVNAGFTPESAVQAVAAEDEELLVHTGLVSVQLNPPGADAPALPTEGPIA